MKPRSLDDPPALAWVWDPKARAFRLPRSVRLPKWPRRLARQQLREEGTRR